jgi:hypothetical protein
MPRLTLFAQRTAYDGTLADIMPDPPSEWHNGEQVHTVTAVPNATVETAGRGKKGQ